MKLVKKYLITMAAGLLAVLLIILTKDIFAQTDAKTIFHILCDAFFAVGVVMAGMGLLVFSTNEGVFDGLAFGVMSFINMFRKDVDKKYKNYFEYKESKGDRKISFGFLLVCGVVILAVSVIMYMLYLKNE